MGPHDDDPDGDRERDLAALNADVWGEPPISLDELREIEDDDEAERRELSEFGSDA